MKYKMVCIDMDGTLLGKRRQISNKSKEVIKNAHDKGVEIVVTTGRIYNNAAYFSHILGVESPVIAANGAIVREKHTDRVIYESPIPKDDCIRLIEILYKNKMQFHFYTNDMIYSSNKFVEFGTKIYMTKQIGYESLKIKYDIIRDIEEWKILFEENHRKITKCIVFSVSPQKLARFKDKINEIKSIVCFGSGSHSLEINYKDASKGEAVRQLAKHYGFNRDEIICIGDNENDVSMIEYAGLGIAMENAIEDVKKVADYITDNNKNDGVAKAIEKFILAQ
ncbi:Cof-type HAD-IIB family hydrolase [Clostridium sp.]|uniref:Cof-type HAD-IIB family hydrolase n=1 Tax=Clostridium sp. TaxID=1506 RepID=UPI003F3F64F3